MRRWDLRDFVGGWIVGDFDPSLVRTSFLEVGFKYMPRGVTEPLHYQRTATEFTVVLVGTCQIGDEILEANDILEIPPGQAASFRALSDSLLAVVKVPSLPGDKVLGPTLGDEHGR